MYFCYGCNDYIQPTENFCCSVCGSDFIEEMDQEEVLATMGEALPYLPPPVPQPSSQPRRVFVQSFNNGGGPMVFPSLMPPINPFAAPVQGQPLQQQPNNANWFPFFPPLHHSQSTVQNFPTMPSNPNNQLNQPNQPSQPNQFNRPNQPNQPNQFNQSPVDFGQLLAQIATAINTDIQNNQFNQGNQPQPSQPSQPSQPNQFNQPPHMMMFNPFAMLNSIFGGNVVHTTDLFSENMEQVLNHLFETARFSGPPPASKEAVKGIPRITIHDQNQISELGDACAVCKDDFEIGQEALQLPCKHSYHPDCILQWLESKNTCPVCRYEFPTDDPEYEQKRIKKQEQEETRRRNAESHESSPSATSTTASTSTSTASSSTPIQET